MPPGCLPGEVFWARATGRRPKGRPRTRWRDYVSHLARERLGIPPEELAQVAGEREVWASRLRLLPPRTLSYTHTHTHTRARANTHTHTRARAHIHTHTRARRLRGVPASLHRPHTHLLPPVNALQLLFGANF
uniref:Uncharacterized protein n=1 Tax=Nothobranchius furzeri TaxID=105023 RepID=A0A8C6NVN1_NOTFU